MIETAKAALLRNIRRHVELTDDEADRVLAVARLTSVKRREWIIEPGKVCQYRSYIVKGAFRVYHIDKKGKEHTVSIGVEDWFVTDFLSYITRTAAENYAEALENSLIVQLHYDDIEPLCSSIHNLSEYFRLTTERAFAYSRRRVISSIGKSATERYLEYADLYPHIVNRVPQYVLASYLGVTPEFLSKIRSKNQERS